MNKKRVCLFVALILALFNITSAFALNSLGRPGAEYIDSNGVWFDYWRAAGWDTAGTESNPVDPSALIFSHFGKNNSTIRVQKPISAFQASYGGTTVDSGSGTILSVPIGASVSFRDTSRAGSGGSVNKYDFQIHSHDKSQDDESFPRIPSSYKFEKPGTYYAYLNVYDNMASYYTRNWGNYSTNGQQQSLGIFDGIYGIFPYSKITIAVCEDPELKVEHVVSSTGWKPIEGYNGFPYQQSEKVKTGQSITVSAINSAQLNKFDPPMVYKGFQVKPPDVASSQLRQGTSYTYTPEQNKNITVRFVYAQVGGGEEIEPPDGDPPDEEPPRGDRPASFTWTEGFYEQGSLGSTIEYTEFFSGGSTQMIPGDAAYHDIVYEESKQAQMSIVWQDPWDEHPTYQYYHAAVSHDYDCNGNCVSRYYEDDFGNFIAAKAYELGDVNFSENNSTGFSWVFKKYTPVEIPPPDGVEPPEIEVKPSKPIKVADISTNVRLDIDSLYLNYKSLEGDIGGTANSSYKINNNETNAKLKSSVTEISFMDFSYSQGSKYTKRTTGSTVKNSHKLTPRDIGTLLVGTPGVSTSYSYGMRAYTEASLDQKVKINGRDEYIKASDMQGGLAELPLTNEAPNTTMKMNSNYNGLIVKDGYYYRNTPIELTATFTDPEEDIVASKLEIGRGNIIGSNVVYSNTVGTTNNGVDITGSSELLAGEDYNISKVNNTITEMKQVYTPLKEGVYWYKLEITDAKEMIPLQKNHITEGTFLVRSDVAPPEAIITDPSFAFENEEVEYKQASTDPNGVDDIQEYEWTTPEIAKDKPYSNPIDGGKLIFPPGTSQQIFEIGLKVKDTTELEDSTTHSIKIIDDIPIAKIRVVDNNGSNIVKENRKITVSVDKSLSSKKYPILWKNTEWTVYAEKPANNKAIHISSGGQNGNKNRELQFDTPGVYYVNVKMANEYSLANPTSPDIAAAQTTFKILVVEDKIPNITVTIESGKPNFIDNPTWANVKFKATSESIDGDKIVTPSAYTWKVYEDKNSDGNFTSDELLPSSSIQYNSTRDMVTVKVNYALGRHNVLKAVAEVTETFGEPTLTQFLNVNNSSVRKNTASNIETVNWIPKINLVPESGQPYETLDTTDPNYNKDIKYLKAYTDDYVAVRTNITDELPQTCNVEWSLSKMVKGGEYSQEISIGSDIVDSLLGHDGGKIRIDSAGFYQLKARVIDDCGDTGDASIFMRIYTLPQARLEANNKYDIYNEGWTVNTQTWRTKENIRFDLRSDPCIVDDEWGPAWHRMNYSRDCFEITPLDGQSLKDIHIMNPEYTARYNTSLSDNKVVGTYTRLGEIPNNKGLSNYRAISFTAPGRYEFRYWGENYGGKITVPVKYNIYVVEDLPPNIYGTLEPTFYRDPADGNRATIRLGGPYSPETGVDALTAESPDGDYIDYTEITVTHDSNNNKLFTDSTDKKWLLEENGTLVNGLIYELKKIPRIN